MEGTLAHSGLKGISRPRQRTGLFVMAVTILVLGFYLLYPIALILAMSLNVAKDVFVRTRE